MAPDNLKANEKDWHYQTTGVREANIRNKGTKKKGIIAITCSLFSRLTLRSYILLTCFGVSPAKLNKWVSGDVLEFLWLGAGERNYHKKV